MSRLNITEWLTSRPERDWDSFRAYGDVGFSSYSHDHGCIWFNYIVGQQWATSVFDTRALALEGNETALEHMTNYCVALIAARLKGNLI